MTFPMKVLVKRATKFKLVNLNSILSTIKIKTRKLDLQPVVDQQQVKISTDNLDYLEEQVYLNLSSSFLEFQVRVTNMIPLYNSSINRQLKEHASLITSNKAITMLEDKIPNQTMAQQEE